MTDATITQPYPTQSVVLATTAKGVVTIEVKVSDYDANKAEEKATLIFDRLRAKYKEVNDANADFYVGRG
jgi:hypothetical protein